MREKHRRKRKDTQERRKQGMEGGGILLELGKKERTAGEEGRG